MTEPSAAFVPLECIHLQDGVTLATHLQSLMTWWMSNSKAASKMLSRGSGTLLESRNTVRHDCKTDQKDVEETEGASERAEVKEANGAAAARARPHLCVEVQLSGFDRRVAVEESGHQVVVPGAQQLLEFQQDVLVAGEDLESRFTILEFRGIVRVHSDWTLAGVHVRRRGRRWRASRPCR